LTGYSLKGSITFWILMALVVLAVLSGELGDAAQYLLTLVGGVLLYQGGRWFIRIITGGYDPHDGSTAAHRTTTSANQLPERKPGLDARGGQLSEEETRDYVDQLLREYGLLDPEDDGPSLDDAILEVLGDRVLTYKDIAHELNNGELLPSNNWKVGWQLVAARIRANEDLFDVDRTTSPHWVRKAD